MNAALPELLDLIQEIHPLEPNLLQSFAGEFSYSEYPKNYLLQKAGMPCYSLWLMRSGIVRAFFVEADGKERNTWFSFDRQVITDASSFVTQEPAQENIQLLEDSAFFSIPILRMRELMHQHHTIAIWIIRLLEKHYIVQMEDRVSDLQFLDARARYEKLLTIHPGITNRISLGHIASFLNITQETLSRIRADKA